MYIFLVTFKDKVKCDKTYEALADTLITKHINSIPFGEIHLVGIIENSNREIALLANSRKKSRVYIADGIILKNIYLAIYGESLDDVIVKYKETRNKKHSFFCDLDTLSYVYRTEKVKASNEYLAPITIKHGELVESMNISLGLRQIHKESSIVGFPSLEITKLISGQMRIVLCSLIDGSSLEHIKELIESINKQYWPLRATTTEETIISNLWKI